MTAAYTIDQIVEFGPIGRTKVYAEIKSGNLVARKAGRRTIILAEDWERYLQSLPVMGSAEQTAQ